MSARTLLTVLGSLALMAGCGQSEFTVTPLRGTVMCKGRPVTEGLVQVSPVRTGSAMTGKTGTAEIQPDGSFVLTTYSQGDGAVVGKCRITAGPNDPKLPWPFKLKEPIDFDVQPGVSAVVIEVLENGKGKVTPAT
jgi:hypothetical protein